MDRDRRRRRWLAPEVVQTSNMDCGPAALKSLLDGLGESVDYGRLREACQTDVDGTSIDTMEALAQQLGADAEQIMVPPDHVLLGAADCLPAITVVRLPTGGTHFVVVWRRYGPLVQIMDPASGRRWLSVRQFQSILYRHGQAVPAATWREWAGSEQCLEPLGARLRALGLDRSTRRRLLVEADNDPGWRALATLDAATRMVSALVARRALDKPSAGRALLGLWTRCRAGDLDPETAIPAAYWSVRPSEDAGPQPEAEETITLTGAVLVRATGIAAQTSAPPGEPGLSAQTLAAVKAPQPNPIRQAWRIIGTGGRRRAAVVAGLAAVVGLVTVAEALLFRAVLEAGMAMGDAWARALAMLAVLGFLGAQLMLDYPLGRMMWALGRELEVGTRMAFLAKIPLIGDRYFHSRPVSDMAERSHSLAQLRDMPWSITRAIVAAFSVIATAAGIAWLVPSAAWLAATMALAAIGIPLAAQPWLAERDLAVRTHTGALSRFHLDALLGILPIRTHSAQGSVSHEHAELLGEWRNRVRANIAAFVSVHTLTRAAALGLATWLILGYTADARASTAMLLLVYWALALPEHAEQLVIAIRELPRHYNVALRAMEPLGAPEAERFAPSQQDTTPEAAPGLCFEGVSVSAGGHRILADIDLRVESGSHVAVIGSSGAGKSTLLGLLLGWHRTEQGRILVDGEVLTPDRLAALRAATAWVDPGVQLWNDSLYANLAYGVPNAGAPGNLLRQAELIEVLERLPEGLETTLGEGGTQLSGGEGQRVRLARALRRAGAGLVLLDEPFRGLDRPTRSRLLKRVRGLWRRATMLCVTHDIAETEGFDAVVVVEHGRIVETGAPTELHNDASSRYAQLLASEARADSAVWGEGQWRRWAMRDGTLTADEAR